MHPEVLAALRCPVCRGPLSQRERALRCGAGHAFDVARHGYVSFAVGRPSGLVGDDAGMLAARERFLGAGHLRQLADAIASLAGEAGPGLVVEVGAGTAFYLARALDALPDRAGLAVDLSKHAARRAARAHPRADAIVADARATLPLADACAGLALDVFAPRPGAELRRILREDGVLVVARPGQDHLRELRSGMGLLDVDADKQGRLERALSPWFERASSRPLAWGMELSRDDAVALAAMGPSARHANAAARAERAAALPEPASVTASVVVESWRPARA